MCTLSPAGFAPYHLRHSVMKRSSTTGRIALTNRQGDVYDKVIKVVCEQSQVDFEEGGVDESTLKLLKSVRELHSASSNCIFVASFI